MGDRAPKITGMILYFCSVEDIRLILKDYELFITRVG
jgi:hypothetical protein